MNTALKEIISWKTMVSRQEENGTGKLDNRSTNMTNNENEDKNRFQADETDEGRASHGDTTQNGNRKPHTESRCATCSALSPDNVGCPTGSALSSDNGRCPTRCALSLDNGKCSTGCALSLDNGRCTTRSALSLNNGRCTTGSALSSDNGRCTTGRALSFDIGRCPTGSALFPKCSRIKLRARRIHNRERAISSANSPDLEQKEYFCNICANYSVHFCENCSLYYCKTCFISMHPAVGLLREHSVIPATFSHVKQCCGIHGQPVKLFCSNCMRRRCVECVNTTCRQHIFYSNLTERDIDKGKGKLVADMEKLNNAMSSLNVYKDEVDDETIKTEMLALYKKEMIRQEFISFHELLIDREALLCKALDKEVSRRLSGVWRGQETVLTGLQNDEAHLTSQTIDLLQTDSHDTFIKGTASAQDRYAEVHNKISDFHKAWARNSISMDREMNGILSQPFSLFREKDSFSEIIQHVADGGPKICFRQKTMFFNNLAVPMVIHNFVTVTALGPSTTPRYKLVLLHGPRNVLWETKTDSLQGLLLNTPDTFVFKAGKRYLLKLHPSLICHMNGQRKQETEHPPSHMLIIVCK